MLTKLIIEMQKPFPRNSHNNQEKGMQDLTLSHKRAEL